jgi:lactoylglutathione lyase
MSTTITDVGTVAIPVTDQDRAIAFYVDVLGFDKQLDVTTDTGMRWIVVAPPGAHCSLAITAAAAIGHDTGIRLIATNVEQ